MAGVFAEPASTELRRRLTELSAALRQGQDAQDADAVAEEGDVVQEEHGLSAACAGFDRVALPV